MKGDKDRSVLISPFWSPKGLKHFVPSFRTGEAALEGIVRIKPVGSLGNTVIGRGERKIVIVRLEKHGAMRQELKLTILSLGCSRKPRPRPIFLSFR